MATVSLIGIFVSSKLTRRAFLSRCMFFNSSIKFFRYDCAISEGSSQISTDKFVSGVLASGCRLGVGFVELIFWLVASSRWCFWWLLICVHIGLFLFVLTVLELCSRVLLMSYLSPWMASSNSSVVVISGMGRKIWFWILSNFCYSTISFSSSSWLVSSG